MSSARLRRPGLQPERLEATNQVRADRESMQLSYRQVRLIRQIFGIAFLGYVAFVLYLMVAAAVWKRTLF